MENDLDGPPEFRKLGFWNSNHEKVPQKAGFLGKAAYSPSVPKFDERRGCLRKVLGARQELVAAIWLWDHGYEVFQNLAPAGDIDIIAVKEQEILKIDVTTGSWRANARNELVPEFSAAKFPKSEALGIRILVVMPDDSCIWADEVSRRLPIDKSQKAV